MSAFFTDSFRAALAADPALLHTKQFVLHLFQYAPSIENIDPKWVAAKTVAELAAQPGWVELATGDGYPLTRTATFQNRTQGGSTYATYPQYQFDNLTAPREVQAIAVRLNGVSISGTANPLIMVTNTPLGEGGVIFPSDTLISNPDTTIPGSPNQWMIAWPNANPIPSEGPLAISRGAPPFEQSNSQHVWMYPQRANMIAAPSFEAVNSLNYWGTNGTPTRVAEGMHGKWALNVVPTGSATPFLGHLVVESNVFPTRISDTASEEWTVQVSIRGSGNAKVGLIGWDADGRGTLYDWGDESETWLLDSEVWTNVAVHRRLAQVVLACVRIEVEGEGEATPTLMIDRALAERGYLKDWAYFDGDDHFGARDDFSWYGGANRAGNTYSFWYSNRKAVLGRLFAMEVDPSTPSPTITDELIEEQGLAYRWVPAGIAVIPHIDVLYPYDVRSPLPSKGALTLYYDAVNQPGGVPNPWVPQPA